VQIHTASCVRTPPAVSICSDLLDQTRSICQKPTHRLFEYVCFAVASLCSISTDESRESSAILLSSQRLLSHPLCHSIVSLRVPFPSSLVTLYLWENTVLHRGFGDMHRSHLHQCRRHNGVKNMHLAQVRMTEGETALNTAAITHSVPPHQVS